MNVPGIRVSGARQLSLLRLPWRAGLFCLPLRCRTTRGARRRSCRVTLLHSRWPPFKPTCAGRAFTRTASTWCALLRLLARCAGRGLCARATFLHATYSRRLRDSVPMTMYRHASTMFFAFYSLFRAASHTIPVLYCASPPLSPLPYLTAFVAFYNGPFRIFTRICLPGAFAACVYRLRRINIHLAAFGVNAAGIRGRVWRACLHSLLPSRRCHIYLYPYACCYRGRPFTRLLHGARGCLPSAFTTTAWLPTSPCCSGIAFSSRTRSFPAAAKRWLACRRRAGCFYRQRIVLGRQLAGGRAFRGLGRDGRRRADASGAPTPRALSAGAAHLPARYLPAAAATLSHHSLPRLPHLRALAANATCLLPAATAGGDVYACSTCLFHLPLPLPLPPTPSCVCPSAILGGFSFAGHSRWAVRCVADA